MSRAKPESERFKRLNVTLPDDVADRLRRWGAGNLSAGIREAVRKALRKTGEQK